MCIRDRSSGASHPAKRGTIGSCYAPGCCHAFTADGRCVSLLKVLMSNCCAFDCSYCVNRKSNDVPRDVYKRQAMPRLYSVLSSSGHASAEQR